jgi:hypothetical protein
MQFVAGCVKNLKIMVMKGLKNYAELYLMFMPVSVTTTGTLRLPRL